MQQCIGLLDTSHRISLYFNAWLPELVACIIGAGLNPEAGDRAFEKGYRLLIDEIFTVLGQLGIVAACGAIGAILSRRDFHIRPFVAALTLYVVYDLLLTRGFFLLPNLPTESSWNWLGKGMSFAVFVVIAFLPRFGPARVGLTFRQRPGLRTPLIVFFSLLGVFFYLAASDTSGMADIETIAFQWTMPSLDEELFYRGVLLLTMNEAFSGRASILGAKIGYGGLLTSLLFGLAHGLGYADGNFRFDAMIFAMTGIPSLLLLWLRARTGSLLLPMLAHSAANGLSTVI